MYNSLRFCLGNDGEIGILDFQRECPGKKFPFSALTGYLRANLSSAAAYPLISFRSSRKVSSALQRLRTLSPTRPPGHLCSGKMIITNPPSRTLRTRSTHSTASGSIPSDTQFLTISCRRYFSYPEKNFL
jgi:hypothetical protein